MRKYRFVYLPMYDMYVYYVCCTRRERDLLIRRTFGQAAPPLEEYVSASFESWEKEIKKGLLHQIGVIWVDSTFHKNSFSSDRLVHELFHCVHWILDSKGLTLTDGSQEAYAYLIGYLYKELSEGKKKA